MIFKNIDSNQSFIVFGISRLDYTVIQMFLIPQRVETWIRMTKKKLLPTNPGYSQIILAKKSKTFKNELEKCIEIFRRRRRNEYI